MNDRFALRTYKKMLPYIENNKEKIIVVGMGLLISVILAFHLMFLTKSPVVFIDEPWNANTAWTWLTTGVNFDQIHTGTLDQFGFEWIRRPYIGTLPWVGSFAVFGLGLFQARLVSFVFGVLLILAVVLAGYKCYRLSTGIVAALFLSLSYPFFLSSHYARQDIMLATTVMFAFALSFWAFEKNKLWMHFLVGLILGLSIDIHQNAILFIPGFASLYVVTYKTQLFRKSGTWMAIAGGTIGLLYYVGFHILPNPSVFFTYLKMNDILRGSQSEGSFLPPVITLNLRLIYKSAYGELSRFNFYENPLDFALIGASIIFLGFRRKNVDRALLIFVIITYLSFVLFQGDKPQFYSILLYPFLLIIPAETIISLIFGDEGFNLQKIFILSLLLLYVLNGVRHLDRSVEGNQDYDYYAITSEIKSGIPADARVLGSPVWWFGLTEFDYRSNLVLNHYNFLNHSSVEGGLSEVRPDIIIVDDDFLRRLDYFLPSNNGLGIGKFPRTDFERFLEYQGEELLRLETPYHGVLEIYKIDWKVETSDANNLKRNSYFSP